MTNDETFEILGRSMGKSFRLLNELKEENDKLKAEIEQDKRRLENQRNNLIDLRKSYASAIKEIEKLKAELEQSEEENERLLDRIYNN